MLEPQLTSGHWHRWLVRSSFACGAVVAAIGLVRWAAPNTPPLPAVVALPIAIPSITVVQVPAPAPAPMPPPPVASVDDAPPPPPPPVIHRGCMSDVSVIGTPLGAPQKTGALSAAATPDGCTLAVWTDSTLSVSWDGGQTFEAMDLSGEDLIMTVAVTPDRVAVIAGGGRLGVAHAATGTLVWRQLDVATLDGRETSWHLYAAGAWIAVATDQYDTVHPRTHHAAVSNDDGGSWIYVEAPAPDARFTGLTPDGQLVAERYKSHDTEDAPMRSPDLTRWRFDLRRPAWHAYDTLAGRLAARSDATAYVWRADQYWGCGGSDALVALGPGGRTTELRSHHREEVAHVGLTAGHRFAYLLDEGAGEAIAVSRLDGAHETAVPAIGDDVALRPVGVDASGSLLAIANDSTLVRWSPGGSWRALYTYVQPDED